MSLRAKRVHATATTSFRFRETVAYATIRLSADRSDNRIDAWDYSVSQRVHDPSAETLEVALDVPSDATVLQIELTVSGDAEARFSAPRLAITSAPRNDAAPLDAQRTDSFRALAQLVGYLRFFHPADEVATRDWPTFEAEAVRRMLTAQSRAELRSVLSWVTATVAPTARLYEDGHPPSPLSPPRGAGTRLTRWVRIGSGDDGEPYSAFREEISEPSDVGIGFFKTVPSQGCKHATVRLGADTESGTPTYELQIIPRRGSGTVSISSQIVPRIGSIEGDIPSDAAAITYGVRIASEGTAVVTKVELTCGTQVLGSFSSTDAPRIFGTANHLYSWTQDGRCRGCIRVERRAEEAYDRRRDQVDVPIGIGLRLWMPLALWTDGRKTFPQAAKLTEEIRPLPPNDPATRIASVIDIWSTLRWFYPYMDDLHIDWSSELPRALAAASQARSADEQLVVLRRMVAALQDDHASVYRRSYDDGVLPLVLHWIDSRLYVIDGVDGYQTAVPRGSILESIDGVPADILIQREISATSAATTGWRNGFFPLTLSEGPLGVLLSITAKHPDGGTVTVRVPRVARSKYVLQKHARRPDNGSEVAAGVYYLDLGSLDASTLENLIPKLGSARAIICDARQEATPTSFQVLAHYIDHEIKSPFWDSPIASIDQKRYERTQSSIVPLAPRLSARLLFAVSGRTASAPETILQYAHAAGIGIVVGEPTGGTNGNIAFFSSLGDLRVRFTGLRALNQDGSQFHGRGIIPDVVVHPTTEGIRAGRDEILEAAIARASTP